MLRGNTLVLAALGEKTRLATIMGASQSPACVAVWLARTLGMVRADGLAILAGTVLGTPLPATLMRDGAAIILGVTGAVTLVTMVLPPEPMRAGVCTIRAGVTRQAWDGLREPVRRAQMRARWVWGGILVGSVLLMGSAWAVHLPWMEGLTSADGTSCCREVDCVPADVHLRSAHGDLLVNGQPVRLPLGSIHPVPPEETHGWWCHRSEPGCSPPTLEISERCGRCAFFPRQPGEG